MTDDAERLAVVESRLDGVDGAVERLVVKVDGVLEALARLRGGMVAIGGLWTLIVGAAVLVRVLWR